MACYPIIFIIAGLSQHDIPKSVSNTVETLFENCTSVDKRDYLPPSTYGLLDLLKYNEKGPKDLDDLINHNHKLDIEYPPLDFEKYFEDAQLKNTEKKKRAKKNNSKMKYGNDKLGILLPSSYLKKYIKEVHLKGIEKNSRDKTKNNKIKYDDNPGGVKLSSLLNKYLENAPIKGIDKVSDKLKTNDIDAQKLTHKKKLLREALRALSLHTISEPIKLIQTFKNREPYVAISTSLLKQLTNLKDTFFENNPLIINMLSKKRGKKPIYIGLPTKYLAKMIIASGKRSKSGNTKLYSPIFGKLQRVLDAALEFVDIKEPPRKLNHQERKKVIYTSRDSYEDGGYYYD